MGVQTLVFEEDGIVLTWPVSAAADFGVATGFVEADGSIELAGVAAENELERITLTAPAGVGVSGATVSLLERTGEARTIPGTPAVVDLHRRRLHLGLIGKRVLDLRCRHRQRLLPLPDRHELLWKPRKRPLLLASRVVRPPPPPAQSAARWRRPQGLLTRAKGRRCCPPLARSTAAGKRTQFRDLRRQ